MKLKIYQASSSVVAKHGRRMPDKRQLNLEHHIVIQVHQLCGPYQNIIEDHICNAQWKSPLIAPDVRRMDNGRAPKDQLYGRHEFGNLR